jgi:hypothetical protein
MKRIRRGSNAESGKQANTQILSLLKGISQQLKKQKENAADQEQRFLTKLQEIDDSVDLICQEIGRQLQRQDEAERMIQGGKGNIDAAEGEQA